MYIKACRMSVKRMSSNDLLVNRLSVAWQRLPWAEHSLVLSRDIIVTSGITAASTPPVQPACLSLLQRHAVGTPSTLTHMHMCTHALLLAQTLINIFIYPSLGCHMQLYHILIPWKGCQLMNLECTGRPWPRADKNCLACHWFTLFIILIMDESSKPACPTKLDRMKGYLTTAAPLRSWSYSKSTTTDSPLTKAG